MGEDAWTLNNDSRFPGLLLLNRGLVRVNCQDVLIQFLGEDHGVELLDDLQLVVDFSLVRVARLVILRGCIPRLFLTILMNVLCLLTLLPY